MNFFTEITFASVLGIFLGLSFVVFTFKAMVKSYNESKENIEKQNNQ